MNPARIRRPTGLPHPLFGHLARRDGTLATELSVELGVEGIVEDHSADIDQARRQHHHGPSAGLDAASESAGGQTQLDQTVGRLEARARTIQAFQVGVVELKSAIPFRPTASSRASGS
jgi:hypothetical protein